jgi:hypothetical protein
MVVSTGMVEPVAKKAKEGDKVEESAAEEPKAAAGG